MPRTQCSIAAVTQGSVASAKATIRTISSLGDVFFARVENRARDHILVLADGILAALGMSTGIVQPLVRSLVCYVSAGTPARDPSSGQLEGTLAFDETPMQVDR